MPRKPKQTDMRPVRKPKKTAMLVHENGNKEIVSPLDSARGFTRADMQRLIDAKYLQMADGIEAVIPEPKTQLLKGALCFSPQTGALSIRTGMLLVFDEEGRQHGKSLNLEATEIYACHCGGNGYIVGKALWVDAKDLEQ